MTDELARRCARAVHVVTADGRTLAAGRASLFVIGVVGWPRLAWWLGWPPLSWLIEAGYWLVAKNRRRLTRPLEG
jgi:predicted DCC family thiol-disulfide oxidoreductase YuxK